MWYQWGKSLKPAPNLHARGPSSPRHCDSHKPCPSLRKAAFQKKTNEPNIIHTTSYANSRINSDPIYTSQQSFLLVAGLLIAGLQLLPPCSSQTSGAWTPSSFSTAEETGISSPAPAKPAPPAPEPGQKQTRLVLFFPAEAQVCVCAASWSRLVRGWKSRRWPGPAPPHFRLSQRRTEGSY